MEQNAKKEPRLPEETESVNQEVELFRQIQEDERENENTVKLEYDDTL